MTHLNGNGAILKTPEELQIRIASQNEVIEKLQRKHDRALFQAADARALVFDLLYPNGYKTEEGDFKERFIYYQTELKKVIHQRDEIRHAMGKKDDEIRRLKNIIRAITVKEAE